RTQRGHRAGGDLEAREHGVVLRAVADDGVVAARRQLVALARADRVDQVAEPGLEVVGTEVRIARAGATEDLDLARHGLARLAHVALPPAGRLQRPLELARLAGEEEPPLVLAAR